MKRLLLFIASVLMLSSNTALAETSGGTPPLPSELPLLDYEARLYPFIASRDFAGLGWIRDKEWRDTGPFVLDTNYGVHPAVRIYYSPEVKDWLEGGRKGQIPDGAMIVKESRLYIAALRKLQFDLTQKLQNVLVRIPFPSHLLSPFQANVVAQF